MKAVVFKGIGSINLEEVSEPHIKKPTDALVRLTLSGICGTDLHFVRGSVTGMEKGTILGHEGVGVVESVGEQVKEIQVGDRVIISATIACGACDYCKQELYSQCDNANPQGKEAGTTFFGGPKESGSFNGTQAEKIRVPFADVNLIKIPAALSDEQVVLVADILPTASMSVDMADVQPDDTVAVFGCGPVGQLVIACLKERGVKKIFAVDYVNSRLLMAEKQGAQTINFNSGDPVKKLKALTQNKGPSKVIDAVGIDAESAQCCGIEFFKGLLKKTQFKKEVEAVAPKINPDGNNWYPGNAPSQVFHWAAQSVAKGGTISIIGVYPASMIFFPIGVCMSKNVTIKIANCDHLKYIPQLLRKIEEGKLDMLPFITHLIPLEKAIEAYKNFDLRENGWVKVVLKIS